MEKQSFDAGWEFTDSQGMFGLIAAQWQPITLPHDAAISRPRSSQHPTGGAGGFAWSGVITYRKKFTAPEAWRTGSVQLELEGVYMNAEVSLNGHLAALHPYGYTSFLVDLSPHLAYGAENTLLVVANNSAQPNSRWYSGSGLYRHTWLRISSSPAYIQPWGVFVTTPTVFVGEPSIHPAVSSVEVMTEIVIPVGAPEGVTLCSTILDASGAQAAQVERPVDLKGASIKVWDTLPLKDVRLWSVDQPHLYTLVSELRANGAALDTERTVFGVRKVEVDAQQGFRLNGVPLKLKGGCVHHDNGLLGAASYDRAEERKIELMKSAGFNAIRCAHNPPAPAMLEACDRLGMLVIDETFDCWRMGKNPNDYHLAFEDWWQRDTAAMVRRDRNHPSLILWSIGNEVPERTGVSDGYAWCREQADFVRSLDPTRLVTSAVPFLFEEPPADASLTPETIFDFFNAPPAGPETDRWGSLTRDFFTPLDVGGYNYLYGRYAYDAKQFPERVICGTETFPHQAYATWDATLRLPNVIGDFVWTSLGYLGESGIGICGFKRPQSYYRDILWGLRRQPFIAVLPPQLYGKKLGFTPWGWEPVIASWTFPGWEGKPVQVDVYSADDEVELFINGASAGRQPAGAACQNKATFHVSYTPGEISAIGYTKDADSSRTCLKTAAAPAALRLSPDRSALRSQPGDLSYVTLEIVDAAGQRVTCAEDEISVMVEGPGDLLAIGAANPTSEDLYVGSQRKAFEGRLMLVIRATGATGAIHLTAHTPGLPPAEINLLVGDPAIKGTSTIYHE